MATIYEISEGMNPSNWSQDDAKVEKALAECASKMRKPSGMMAHTWEPMSAVRTTLQKEGKVFARDMGVWVRVKPVAANLAAAPVKPAAPANANLATPKQIGYLQSLIDNDPAAAMALNISSDNLHTLTKSAASRLINQMNHF